jgi:signal transduction histidine kinase
MIPRFLNLQGMIGIAVSLLLLGLLVTKAVEARRWHRQAGRFEQSYLAEQSARVATIANYRAAAEAARAADLANAGRVAAAQRTISDRTSHDFETRLADARARAQRLQLAPRSPAGVGGGARAAPVPAAGPAAGAARGAAAQDRLPVAADDPAQDLSLDDRLIATEQAIQLDELIKWVNAQARIDAKPAGN